MAGGYDEFGIGAELLLRPSRPGRERGKDGAMAALVCD
jgi:hypothetical protein